MSDPITEFDLMAYADGQLDAARRIAVEEHLARHPDLAARVMDDLCCRDELRMGLDAVAGDRFAARTLDLGRRLQTRLRLRWFSVRMRRIAAMALLILGGWSAHAVLGGWWVETASAASTLPVYADEAADAYRTVVVEERIGPTAWAHEEPHRLAVLAARGSGHRVPLPSFPAGFELVGSQLVPWDAGRAVQMVYHDAEDRPLMLFAVELDDFDVWRPRAESLDGFTLVHWRHGWFGYVVIGTLPEERLLTVARRIWR